MSVTYCLAEFPKFNVADDVFGAPPTSDPPADEPPAVEPPVDELPATTPLERAIRDHLQWLEQWPFRRRRPQTDLLKVLEPHDPDRAWLEETVEVMRSLRKRHAGLTLVACDRSDDGTSATVAVALATRLREVRRGDQVCAGFAVQRSGDAAPCVLPRIYRPVCTNGAVTFSHHGEAVARTGNLGEQIEALIDPRVFEPSIDRLREAARTPIARLDALLSRLRLSSPRDELLEAFAAEGDRTHWGLINAATAAARREGDWRRRLERERDAERILAALESDPRSHLVARKAVPVAIC